MEKIKWSEKVTTNAVLEGTGEKRTLLNNMLRRIACWIEHILIRNCLFQAVIEGHIKEVKGIGGKRAQLLDD